MQFCDRTENNPEGRIPSLRPGPRRAGGVWPTRAWQFLVLLGLVGLAAAGLWWYLTPPPPLPHPGPAPVEKAKMESLSLTEIEQGGKRWKLHATKAEYLSNRDEIRIRDIYLEFYGSSDEEVVYLWADEGLVNTKNRDVAVRGAVKLTRGDTTILTGQARYLPQERVLVAPEEVVLEGPRIQVSGKDLYIDLAQNRLILKQHRLTTLKLEKGLL
uniref:LPS export ABC transporter periplasmic protein LptC n=1 Tax=Desulfobacca acetoxidans TaxID=60893 RepID=A0A7C3UZM1_9BACT